MKKVFLAACMLVFLGSCSSSKLASSSSAISNISDAANTVNEILSLTNSLGLTNTQKSVLTSSLTNYITKYQQLSTVANATSQLTGLKTSTLSSITSALGKSKSSAFLDIVKASTVPGTSNVLSQGAVSVLSSLL